MPTYDYRCSANGITLEARHSMKDQISNWGELCELTGQPLGETPADEPVEKVIGASAVHTPKIGEWKRTGKKKTAAGHVHSSSCGCGH
jgi:predicted nucleic acid-binding Zn ribbon protein